MVYSAVDFSAVQDFETERKQQVRQHPLERGEVCGSTTNTDESIGVCSLDDWFVLENAASHDPEACYRALLDRIEVLMPLFQA